MYDRLLQRAKCYELHTLLCFGDVGRRNGKSKWFYFLALTIIIWHLLSKHKAQISDSFVEKRDEENAKRTERWERRAAIKTMKGSAVFSIHMQYALRVIWINEKWNLFLSVGNKQQIEIYYSDTKRRREWKCHFLFIYIFRFRIFSSFRLIAANACLFHIHTHSLCLPANRINTISNFPRFFFYFSFSMESFINIFFCCGSNVSLEFLLVLAYWTICVKKRF